MGRSERIRRAHERAEQEIRNDPTLKLLKERMAYHRAKMAEERQRAERRAAMPAWRRLLPF
jgi:hypothetical protein